jgi:hypothetical protein
MSPAAARAFGRSREGPSLRCSAHLRPTAKRCREAALPLLRPRAPDLASKSPASRRGYPRPHAVGDVNRRRSGVLAEVMRLVIFAPLLSAPVAFAATVAHLLRRSPVAGCQLHEPARGGLPRPTRQSVQLAHPRLEGLFAAPKIIRVYPSYSYLFSIETRNLSSGVFTPFMGCDTYRPTARKQLRLRATRRSTPARSTPKRLLRRAGLVTVTDSFSCGKSRPVARTQIRSPAPPSCLTPSRGPVCAVVSSPQNCPTAYRGTSRCTSSVSSGNAHVWAIGSLSPAGLGENGK